jgi:hypothetical protein
LKVTFFVDPDTKEPHIYKHDVKGREIVDFFNHIKYFEIKRKDGSYVGYAKMPEKRYLKVVFRKINKEEVFVVTAFDIEDRQMIHFLEEQLD